MQIVDDGVGFDPPVESEGQGLQSMRRRAQHLGGTLAVTSAAGQGATVILKIPLTRPRLISSASSAPLR